MLTEEIDPYAEVDWRANAYEMAYYRHRIHRDQGRRSTFPQVQR